MTIPELNDMAGKVLDLIDKFKEVFPDAPGPEGMAHNKIAIMAGLEMAFREGVKSVSHDDRLILTEKEGLVTIHFNGSVSFVAGWDLASLLMDRHNVEIVAYSPEFDKYKK